jgi:hypothetical protein
MGEQERQSEGEKEITIGKLAATILVLYVTTTISLLGYAVLAIQANKLAITETFSEEEGKDLTNQVHQNHADFMLLEERVKNLAERIKSK